MLNGNTIVSLPLSGNRIFMAYSEAPFLLNISAGSIFR